MYQKQILMEKLKEATASVLPISLIVMAISFVLVPVDAGLMLSFVIATAMLILGMGLFTLGADMSMSRIGNYMGSKLTKSRKLPLILTVSFALGVAITVAEPDLQVLAGNVPEIDTTVLILTVSVGVGFFLMLCMVRILFSISLRTTLIKNLGARSAGGPRTSRRVWPSGERCWPIRRSLSSRSIPEPPCSVWAISSD